MTPERAREVNALVVGAWLVQQGFRDGPVPDLRGVTLAECLEATAIMTEDPGEPLPGGGRRFTCHVNADRVPRLYAWAALQRQDTTYGRR